MSNPHDMTRDFEKALCAYTGAPYAVAVNSCTMALTLAVAWHFADQQRKVDAEAIAAGQGMKMIALRPPIEIPKRTYCSVPMAIIHAGGRPTFRDDVWLGSYQLKPIPVWDCARTFFAGMFNRWQMLCVSFHWTKILGVPYHQGGAILHDSPEADAWFRRARFDGRTEHVAPKDDNFDMIGFHCYLDPTTAGRLLKQMQFLKSHNDPLPWGPGTTSDYPDLSLHKAFQ